MNIIIAYTRLDFWGCQDSVEDIKYQASKDDAKKALRFLARTYDAAVHSFMQGETTYSLYWESLDDFENKIITYCESPKWTIKNITRMSFDKGKKEMLKRFE